MTEQRKRLFMVLILMGIFVVGLPALVLAPKLFGYEFVGTHNGVLATRGGAKKIAAQLERDRLAAREIMRPEFRAWNQYGCAYDAFSSEYNRYQYVPVMTLDGPLCDPARARPTQ